MITPQSLYDQVWDHFIVKRSPPGVNTGAGADQTCKYRADNGAKCAFGIMIPDEEYKPEMEGKIAKSLFDSGYFSSAFHELMHPHYYWFSSLQRCHDNAVAESLAYGRDGSNFHWFMQEEMVSLANMASLSNNLLQPHNRIIEKPNDHITKLV